MVALPLAATAIHEISRYLLATENQKIRLLRITAVWAISAGLILSAGRFEPDAWRAEDPSGARTFAASEASGLEHLAQWLECNTRAGAGGRVFTYFDYGSALTWRLAGYSMSIDGRTIFPDSVAEPEAFYDPLKEPLREGPWRSANLAIMPARGAVAGILDRAPGWRRAAMVQRMGDPIALWVTDAWWATQGDTELQSPAPTLGTDFACVSRKSMTR